VAWEQRLSGVITSRPVVRLRCVRARRRANGQGEKIGATGNCDNLYPPHRRFMAADLDTTAGIFLLAAPLCITCSLSTSARTHALLHTLGARAPSAQSSSNPARNTSKANFTDALVNGHVMLDRARAQRQDVLPDRKARPDGTGHGDGRSERNG
jgi:hypothetical protein